MSVQRISYRNRSNVFSPRGLHIRTVSSETRFPCLLGPNFDSKAKAGLTTISNIRKMRNHGWFVEKWQVTIVGSHLVKSLNLIQLPSKSIERPSVPSSLLWSQWEMDYVLASVFIDFCFLFFSVGKQNLSLLLLPHFIFFSFQWEVKLERALFSYCQERVWEGMNCFHPAQAPFGVSRLSCQFRGLKLF